MLVLPSPKRLLLGYLLGATLTSVTLGLVIVLSLNGSTKATSTAQHTVKSRPRYRAETQVADSRRRSRKGREVRERYHDERAGGRDQPGARRAHRGLAADADQQEDGGPGRP
jgi:hypothetical protein